MNESLYDVVHALWCNLFPGVDFSAEDSFSFLKGNAKQADQLFFLMEEALGSALRISPTIAYDYPTLNKQVEYLERLREGLPESALSVSVSPAQAPVAIIGMACRFPGEANGLDALWHLLLSGKDAIEDIPASRWDRDKFYDADRKKPGKMVCKQGGFITDHDKFDADFFRITPKEAEFLDPNQRIALETAWHALEHACIDPKTLIGTCCGVFMGVVYHDYARLLARADLSTQNTGYLISGALQSTVAGRIAYTLGTCGPAMVIDTACSSSLVAVHEACQTLRSGSCELALAGGVNLLMAPDLSISISQANMLSPASRCKTFSHDADGYVRSEGCGVVVLKRLSDAERDGDTILAVIKGSAVNQNGASGGISVPSRMAQQSLLSQALANADLSSHDIDYIEAHGTGTPLGDPIETGAIEQVYQGRNRDLYIGSVKSNLGHLEAAAGVAGLIKVVLSLQQQCIPANLHLQRLNPRIALENIPAKIPVEPTPWRQSLTKRNAGISSFGFGGTNAHLIVQEAPVQTHQHVKMPLVQTVFNRKRYWAIKNALEPVKKSNVAYDPAYHPFLQQQVAIYDGEHEVYQTCINTSWPAFIRDHLIYDVPVLAGGAYLSTILSYIKETGVEPLAIEDINFVKAFVIEPGIEYQVQTIVKTQHSSDRCLISSREIVPEMKRGNSGWRLHAESVLNVYKQPLVQNGMALVARFSKQDAIDDPALYQPLFNQMALHYGPQFQWIHALRAQQHEAWVEFRAPDASETLAQDGLPSGLIDAIFQAAILLALKSCDQPITTFVPFTLKRFYINQGECMPHYAHISIRPSAMITPDEIHVDVRLFADDLECIGLMDDVRLRALSEQKLMHKPLPQMHVKDWFYHQSWQLYEPSLVIRDASMAMLTYDARVADKDAINLDAVNALLVYIQHVIRENKSISVLNILTEQAYSVKKEAICLHQASLNGLIKSVIFECPQLHVRQVDLEINASYDPDYLARLPIHENILVIRHGDVYVPRLESYVISEPAAALDTTLFSDKASYLITGGLGGIGLELVTYLSEHGAKRIILAARRIPTQTAQRVIDALGIEVIVHVCDVSDRQQLEELIQATMHASFPLKGIFHAAGVIDDALIEQQSPATFAQVFAAKARGAWYLHDILHVNHILVDYFVLFSSSSSLCGSIGQSNYAVANGFLDALSWVRHQQGLPANSFNWGPWRDVGMAKDHGVIHARQGLTSFKTQEALAALTCLLREKLPQIGILNTKWDVFGARFSHIPSWLSELVHENAEQRLEQQLQHLSHADRRVLLQAELALILKKTMGFSEHYTIDAQKNFFDMGIDSLMALEIKNHAQRLINTPLANTLLFDYPTLDTLSQFIVDIGQIGGLRSCE